MSIAKSLKVKIREYAQLNDRLGKPRIGFGLHRFDERILASLRNSLKWANITIVGPLELPRIEGIETIQDANPEWKIASLLAMDEFEGIVRGTLDFVRTFEAYERLTDEKPNLIPALLEDQNENQFFILPSENAAGWTKEERLGVAIQLGEFIKTWDLVPSIAVYSGIRQSTYDLRKSDRIGVTGFLNTTHEDAEWLVNELTKLKFTAKNWSVDLDIAIDDGWLIHLLVNGMVGNQAFRAFTAGGGKILAAPCLGITRFIEDNTRNETDFSFHIQWLAAQINRHKNDNP